MIQLGRARIDLERREAFIGATPVRLGGRAFEVLQALLAQPNRLLTKHELIDQAWPGCVVEENNLQVQVSQLRKTLGLGADILETVPRRGYRLNLPGSAQALPDAAPAEQPGQVYVVDDDPALRTALVRQLRSHGLAAQAFDGGPALLAGAELARPACVLLDVNLRHACGLDLQTELTRRDLPFAVVFITGFGTVDLTVRAMKGGAQALLCKPFDEPALLTSVHEALGVARQRFAERQARRQAALRFATLSAVEAQLFDALLQGQPSKLIGRALGLDSAALKAHKEHIMAKLGTRSLVEWVLLGTLLGRLPSGLASPRRLA